MSRSPERVEDSPAEVTARADRYTAVGRFAEAERIIRRALASHPEHINLLNKLSYALFRQKRYTEDLEVTEKALALDPDEPVLYYRRGWTLWRLDRKDEAISIALRGLELDPHSELKLFLHRDLGRYYNWLKRHPEAFAIVEKGLAAFPGHPELLEVGGEALRRQNLSYEADEYCKASIVAGPTLGINWYGKALNDMDLYRARDSLAALAQSMLLEPDDGWRAERVRYFMSWPVASYAGSFRWFLPLAAIAAALAALGVPGPWWWFGAGLLAANFGYAAHWLFRGGRLSWTALARLRPIEKRAMTLTFGLANLGVAATATALATGVAFAAWAGLAAAVALWLALAFDSALDPNEDPDESLAYRMGSNLRWWFVDDFTGHPKRQWLRLRHLLGLWRPAVTAPPAAGTDESEAP